VSYAADKWQAFEEADKIRRQVLAQGVTQQEVDRQIANALAARKRPFRRFDADLARASRRDHWRYRPRRGVQRARGGTCSGASRPQRPEGGRRQRRALRAAFAATRFCFSPAPSRSKAKPRSLPSSIARNRRRWKRRRSRSSPSGGYEFRRARQVVETRHLDDLDATLVRFENGVRLNVKSTKYRADQILASVDVAGGDLLP
jgi:hypothetical protein